MKRLNIHALPNQTTIIFWMIVITLLGTVAAGIFGLAPLGIWPLFVGFALFSIRSFFARPDGDFARYNLEPAGEDLVTLQQAIADIACKIGLTKVPTLLVSHKKPDTNEISPSLWKCIRHWWLAEPVALQGPYTFGTVRRWYIAIDYQTACKWQQNVSNDATCPEVEAVILHELYHFKTGDYWQMGFVAALLEQAIGFTLWIITFFTFFGILLALTVPEVVNTNWNERFDEIDTLPPETIEVLKGVLPSEEAWQSARENAENLNFFLVMNYIISAFLPVILAGAVLYAVYWPKLWRTREYYADAGVVHTQATSRPLIAKLTGIPRHFLKRYKPPDPSTGLDMWRKHPWRALRTLTAKHDLPRRLVSMAAPHRVYDNWATVTLVVGIFVMLLDLVVLSPLILFYVTQVPMHFPVISAYILIVLLFVIPQVAQGVLPYHDILKISMGVIALRLPLILVLLATLIILYITDTALVAQMLTVTAATIAGYSRNFTQEDFEAGGFRPDEVPGFIANAAIVSGLQLVVMTALICGACVLTAWLLQRLFSWYALPNAKHRLIKIAYLIIVVVALCLGLTILPIITPLVNLRLDLFLSPAYIGASIIGGALTVLGAGAFFYFDRRFRGYCPGCKTFIGGAYQPDSICPHCETKLHDWLMVEYD